MLHAICTIAMASLAAAEQEPAALAAIRQQLASLQERVGLLEEDKTALRSRVTQLEDEKADLRSRVEATETQVMTAGQSLRVKVSPLGESGRRLTSTPTSASCCRWTPEGSCTSYTRGCTSLHEYLEAKTTTHEFVDADQCMGSTDHEQWMASFDGSKSSVTLTTGGTPVTSVPTPLKVTHARDCTNTTALLTLQLNTEVNGTLMVGGFDVAAALTELGATPVGSPPLPGLSGVSGTCGTGLSWHLGDFEGSCDSACQNVGKVALNSLPRSARSSACIESLATASGLSCSSTAQGNSYSNPSIRLGSATATTGSCFWGWGSSPHFNPSTSASGYKRFCPCATTSDLVGVDAQCGSTGQKWYLGAWQATCTATCAAHGLTCQLLPSGAKTSTCMNALADAAGLQCTNDQVGAFEANPTLSAGSDSNTVVAGSCHYGGQTSPSSFCSAAAPNYYRFCPCA